TSDWKSFNMYSVHPDTIRNNPPPFPAITTNISPQHKTQDIGFQSIQKNGRNVLIAVNNPRNEKILVSVYDLNGRRIENLDNQHWNVGTQIFYWHNRADKSGIYLIKISAPNFSETQKISL
ncbi:MAG: T9SS type A sorting domain-containing protein, partial [Bacteroidetes bacterium]